MITVKVLRKAQEATDIASFELARPDGAPLPSFGAGAHIDVKIGEGMTRQYSLCGDAGDAHRYRIAVLREAASRGGSMAMHNDVIEGDLLQISEPRNHFPLEPADRTILLAGGIGVTPLWCMAKQLESAGADFTLHYCVRSLDRMAFRGEMAAAVAAGRVLIHADTGADEQRMDLDAVLDGHGPTTRLYTCGPAGFIEWVVREATARGWPAERVHKEYFVATPTDRPPDPQPFQVTLARSGRVCDVPAHLTVVQALRACGVDIPVSCEQGVCGTCITGVLQGECDHRDLYFSDEEKALNDQFTPCCSRARSHMLVLDL